MSSPKAAPMHPSQLQGNGYPRRRDHADGQCPEEAAEQLIGQLPTLRCVGNIWRLSQLCAAVFLAPWAEAVRISTVTVAFLTRSPIVVCRLHAEGACTRPMVNEGVRGQTG